MISSMQTNTIPIQCVFLAIAELTPICVHASLFIARKTPMRMLGGGGGAAHCRCIRLVAGQHATSVCLSEK